MRRLLLIAAIAALGAGSAAARPLPEGGATAAEVAQVLRDKGYRAEVTVDGVGDPLVRSALDGSSFGVYFYGCEQGRCTSLQFATGFDGDPLSYETINRWNAEHRFGRAYLDGEMDPVMEMDVDVERGASTELIEEALATWAVLVPEFKGFIGF